MGLQFITIFYFFIIDFGEPEIDFGDSNEVDITCITLEDSGDVARALEEATNQNAEPMDGVWNV